jgi:hypothetical protein
MGKKIKTNIDSSRAVDHPAGSRVLFTQPIYGEHGDMHAHYYRQWVLFWNESLRLYKRLNMHQRRVEEIPPDDSGFRSLYDDKHASLMERYFNTGMAFIENVYLTFQHFSNEALGHYYLHPDNPPESTATFKAQNDKDLKQKLEFICKEVLGTPSLVRHKGYDALITEFEPRRHAINHPNNDNSYNATENDWDKVPLAWLLSGKYKRAFDNVCEFSSILFDAWDAKKKELEKPGNIQAVRGIVSARKPNILKPKS